jgi:hypothetical protein
MLAVVDYLAGPGMFVGGSAATKERTFLEKRDAASRVRQSAGSGESG